MPDSLQCLDAGNMFARLGWSRTIVPIESVARVCLDEALLAAPAHETIKGAVDMDPLGARARDRLGQQANHWHADGGDRQPGGVHEPSRLAGVAKGLLARVFRWRGANGERLGISFERFGHSGWDDSARSLKVAA